MRNRYVLLAKELRGLCTQLHRAGSTKFPSEAELSARYGYSRQTVRKALDLLEQEGSIVRIRGSGTYLSADGRGRAGKVAVITAYTEEYLYPQLLRDIGAELSRSGYEMQRFGSGNRILREREILQQLIQNPPEGILLEGAKTALPSPNLDHLPARAASGAEKRRLCSGRQRGGRADAGTASPGPGTSADRGDF